MKSPDAEREVQIRETYGGKPWSDPMFLLRLLDEARAEIARLRTPPEADVMVRAHRAIAEHVAGNPDGTMWWVTGTFVETVAGLRSSFIRELTEYGDQRAREADMKRFWAEFPESVKELQREARAVAIEDAAQRLDAAYRACIERASEIPLLDAAESWKRAADTYAQAAQYVRALDDKI